MSIILDARSGDSNAPSTGLGFRHVLGHVDPATGGREYREALSEGEYLWLSKSDGDVGRVGLEYRAEGIAEALEGGVFRYAFREEVEVLESTSAGVAVSLTQEGLSFLSSVALDVLRVRVLSPTFYWTSNEGRERFIFEGRTWRLKRGGGVLDMGEFGEDMVLGGGGVVRIGLVYGSALSAYELGGVELPYTDGELSDHVFAAGELGVVSRESGEVRWAEVESLKGMRVFFSSSVLSDGGVVEGGYLAGELLESERPLLRSGYNGGLELGIVVATEGDFTGSGVEVARDTGRISGMDGEIICEGFVLGYSRSLDPVDLVGGQIPDRVSGTVSGLSYLPDGRGEGLSGVAPSGVRADGSGLVKALEVPSCSYIVSGGVAYGVELVESFSARGSTAQVRSSDLSLQLPSGVALGGARFVEALFGLRDWAGNLSGGLMLGLSESTVKAFTDVDDKVGEISSSVFNFLDVLPRRDFSGYSAGVYFKARETLLERGVDYAERFDDKKLEWIKSRIKTGKVETPSSELFLDYGLRSTGISLTLTQEVSEEVFEVQQVTEAEMTVTPNSVILKALVGREKGRGAGGSILNGSVVQGVTGAEVGDWLVFSDRSYRQVLEVQGGELTLSSVEGLQEGPWVLYDGVSSVADPSYLSGEAFREIEVGEYRALSLYKTSPSLVALIESREEGGRLFVLGDGGSRLPLQVLTPSVLSGGVIDLTDVHANSPLTYRLVVGDSGQLTQDVDFTVDNITGEVTFITQVDASLDVLFVPLPMERVGVAECSSDGSLFASELAQVEGYEQSVSRFSFEPTGGKLSWSRPLDQGQGVIAEYIPEGESALVREVLGFTVNNEVCVKVKDRLYSFNASGLSLYEGVTPVVYVGSELLGFAGSPTARLVDGNTIEIPLETSEEVTISYVVTGSVGGDQIGTVASPIYAPSAVIEEGGSVLSLPRDATADVAAGDFLTVGDHAFTVQSVSLAAGVTTITFDSPARTRASGTLTVLNEASTLFAQLAGASFKATPKSNEIVFQGDLSSSIFTSTLLIVGVEAHLVDQVAFDSENGTTTVTVKGLSKGLSSADNLLVSVRPVYLEGVTTIPFRTSVVAEDRLVLIKYESGGLGAELVRGVDYMINVDSGEVELMRGNQVSASAAYFLHHSSIAVIAPRVMSEGRVSYPQYRAEYTVTRPLEGFDGATLSMKAVVDSPDVFYVRVAADSEYISEVSADILDRLNAESNRGSGAIPKSGGTEKRGRAFGFFDLLAEDVVSRDRLSFYDGLVSAHDDILSTMTGLVVGGRDGRFKFELEQSGQYEAVGLEDPITRMITPRYVTFDLFGDGYYLPTDNLPSTDSDYVKRLTDDQKPLIANEIDDYVMVGVKASVKRTLIPPFREVTLKPRFKQMWESSQQSRLYPTTGGFFTTIYGNSSNPDQAGSPVAQLSNGSRGVLENVSSVGRLTERMWRFRVYKYSETGFAEYPATVGKHTLILSAVPFSLFPVSGSTIDLTKFLSEGGSLADVITGNPDLSLKGLSVGDPIALGLPAGSVGDVKDEAAIATAPLPTLPQIEVPRLVRVREIINPCVITLGVYDATFALQGLSDPQVFGSAFRPVMGDTLLQSLASDYDETSDSVKTYRAGVDVGVKGSTGELINIAEPFPFSLLTEQRFPPVGIDLQGSFNSPYLDTAPFEFPALKGEEYNDDGDESIPYLRSVSERDLLPLATSPIRDVLSAVAPSGAYVYPDEIRGSGDISSAGLQVSSSLTPFTDGDIASVDARVGDLVLIKPDNSGDVGDAVTGLTEIAKIDGDTVYAPRFLSPIPLGRYIRYELYGAYVQTDESQSGVSVERVGSVNGAFNVVDLVLNGDADYYTEWYDFAQSVMSGKDNGLDNEMTVTLYELSTTNEVWTLTLRRKGAAVGVGVYHIESWEIDFDGQTYLVDQLLFDGAGTLTIETAANWIDISALAQVDPATSESHGFRVDLDLMDSGSSRASIGDDRLTFSESFNMRLGDRAADVSSSLFVELCQVQVEDYSGLVSFHYSYLNANNYLNAGVAYTFPSVPAGETLSVEVPSYEGEGNVPITRSEPNLALLTGASVNDAGTILSDDEAKLYGSFFTLSGNGQGVLSNVLSGDLVHISAIATGSGQCSKMGTYRVDSVYEGVEQQDIESTVGSSEFAAPLRYPTITSLTDNGDGTYDIGFSEDIIASHYSTAQDVLFYLVLNPADLNLEPPDPDSLVRARGTINGSTMENVGAANIQNHKFNDGTGSNINAAAFEALVTAAIGTGYLAGQDRIPMPLGGAPLSRVRDDGNGLRLQVLSTTTHDGQHSNYFFDIMSEITDPSGKVTHFRINTFTPPIVGTPAHFLSVLYPSDVILLPITTRQGVYIDPVFPRTVGYDYGQTDSNYFGTSEKTGIGRYSDPQTLLYLPFHPSGDIVEVVSVEVRRLRRFTDALSDLNNSFGDLPLLYQERTGVVSSVAASNSSFILTATKSPLKNQDTNVGDFPNVTSLGDYVTLYDAQGVETGKYRVVEVGSTLTLQPIRGTVTGAATFKIEVRSNTIPEVQAFQSAFSKMVEVVFEGTDGRVDELNVLANTEDPTALQGDYLIIDPQGALTGTAGQPANPVEYGAPPMGDRGVQGEPNFVAGQTSNLDDNRGVYKITAVRPTGELEVEGVIITNAAFNYLPTVNGSGGADLRVTAPSDPVTHSFSGTAESIQGFSYRVCRVKAGVDEDHMRAFLFFRERTMSWAEKLGDAGGFPPYGWDEYVSEEYANFIGLDDPTHLSNQKLLGLEGEVTLNPFTNSVDCLSVLDRRAMTEDGKLIDDGYGDTGEAAVSLFKSLLEVTQYRAKRVSWIRARTDRVRGTLPRLSTVNLSNPDTTAQEDL